MTVRIRLLVVIAASLLAFPALARAGSESAAEMEAEIGRKTAAEIEKAYRVADMPEQTARITRIANELAILTSRPDVTYTCKILDTHEVNALSLPGGIIYMTKGLVNGVESDDEVAAVLAHEIAHNVHHDSLELIRRDTRLNKQMVLGILAAVVAGTDNEGLNLGEAMLLGQAIKSGLLNGYTLEAERRADASGMDTLRKSRYSPVAMLTVMEGLSFDRPRARCIIGKTYFYTSVGP